MISFNNHENYIIFMRGKLRKARKFISFTMLI